jgi:glutathione reductase (NADPH)
MAYASHLGEARHLAQDYGWQDTLGAHDWPTLVDFRDRMVANLERAHEGHLERAGVTLIRGTGELIGPGQVRVGEQVLEAKHVVISTGARPKPLDIPGASHILDSDGFWKLSTRPERPIIIGGGYIAIELASVLAGLGSHPILLVRDQLLRGFDRAVADHLSDMLTLHGVDVRLGLSPTHVSESDAGFEVHTRNRAGESDEVFRADACVLAATGRLPNTEGLGLHAVGIELAAAAEVPVNDFDETPSPGLFAIGDVTGRAMLTPVAIKAGRLLAERLFNGGRQTVSYDLIPTAVFSHPPVGTVGLTEESAREQHGEDIRVYQSNFGGLIYSPTPKERTLRTLMKLIVQKSSDLVLGCHIVGPDAPEIIQGFSVAMSAGATKAQFDATLAVHPSSAEELVLMR